MQNIFEKFFNLRTSDFDCHRKISPAAVLDLFQAVAGEHAEMLGCGFEALYSRGFLWVLVRTKYEVVCQPKMYQKVRVKTWPLAPSRVGFNRDYLMEDEQGNILIKGSSDWVIINCETRKIVPATDIYPQMEFLTDTVFEGRLKKISDFESSENCLRIRPGFSQLDMNGHVNNTKYANYAMDALNPTQEMQIKTFQIDYRHEVQKGDELQIHTHSEGNFITVKGNNALDETMFICKIEL